MAFDRPQSASTFYDTGEVIYFVFVPFGRTILEFDEAENVFALPCFFVTTVQGRMNRLGSS